MPLLGKKKPSVVSSPLVTRRVLQCPQGRLVGTTGAGGGFLRGRTGSRGSFKRRGPRDGSKVKGEVVTEASVSVWQFQASAQSYEFRDVVIIRGTSSGLVQVF